jgi:predicted ATPase
VPAREPAVTVSPVEVPAPRSTPPQPVTRLLGRDRELTALRELVLSGEQRLITLTGTGGVGKTRLAGELAHSLADVFADGAAVVSLAPLSDPGAVLPAVARAVGCAVGEGPEAEQQLADHLAPLRLLLVLDNLEHLLAAAQQIAALVSRCPRTVVLVTSRAPLRVRGEAEFPVQPLAVPQAGGDDPTALASCPAVEVFVDRARAVSPGFSVTADNAGPVADLCRRLAGIPLALELAAARLRFLNPQALLARLDEAMARAGGPDLPARQRTLQATFDWSYDLLDGQEQALLRLLSVFAGGCGLEAVEELCAVLGRREPVLPLLEVLVEHSLVVVGTDSEGAPRFSLLEPVAQYARSRQDPAEARATRAAHAAVQLARAERAAPEYLAADQVVWFDRAEREDADCVAAITWSLDTGDAETAGRLGWALWLFWWSRGRVLTGRRLMERALQGEQSARVRWQTRNTAAAMAFALGDVPGAGEHWRAARELARSLDDPLALSQSTAGVALVLLASDDLDGAEEQLRASLPGLHLDDAHADWLASLVHVWLGTVLVLRGELDGAAASVQSGLAAARRRGDRLTAYIALYNLSLIALARGELEVAREHLHEGVRLTQETGDLANLGYLLESLAVVEGARGEQHRTAVLLGAAEAVREAAGAWVYGYYKPDASLREAAAATALAALGDDVYGDTVDAGRGLTPDEAVTYVLTGTDVLTGAAG